MDDLGGQPLVWFDIASHEKALTPKTPVETFYNDIDDKKVLDELVGSLKSQGYGALWSKSTYAAWRAVESTYVMCERDEAILVQAQQGMVANVNKLIEGEGWEGEDAGGYGECKP
ncbi:uncharacterized protein Z518_03572 [Rhinocladiella mackenziei CBS 650.93]|uniref:Uncharacterized protein n=1 Tax=Rhinocladiella mackenziei CBS 650.93 TaxID=1442369 RepID=A0A0D2JHV1_9EURO|nr:uncharacterized protein Z518_03572 [Rhinocladiella mackenziei CBS 650.93]KIX08915.1 hypothetical protein Z518_03572 [Rhinocladiella mackenziei CBS 650.93]